MGGSLSRGGTVEKLQLVQEENLRTVWEDRDPVYQDIKTLNKVPALFEAYETEGK